LSKEVISTALRDWFGIGSGFTIHHVGLRSPWSPLVLLVAVVLGAALAAYLYRRETRLARPYRVLLAVLRTVAYAILMVILFEPFLGLTRSGVVRRNLLVLLDKSQSMGIADVRREPRQLADAALALNKVPFPLAAASEGIAQAQRALHAAAAALKQGRHDDARESQTEAQRALNALVGDSPDAKPADAAFAAIAPALKDLAGQQNGLCETAAKLEAEGQLSADRSREMARTQEAIAEDLDKLAEALLATPVAVPEGARQAVSAVSRIDLANGLLQHPELRVFEKIGKDCKVRLFTFGEKLEPLGETDEAGAVSNAAVVASGKASRGGDAIEEAVSRLSGQPVAGVVVLTDGAFNEGTDPLAVAKMMKERGVPLFPLGLGLEAPEDVGLRSLIVPGAMFPKDEMHARVQVFSQGYVGAKVDVRVLLDDAELAKLPVELTEKPQFVDVPFKIPEGKGGAGRLAVTVSEQPGEVSTANNRIERTVRILDQKIKVLYVEGKPRWEYRYMRVVLLRDPRLSVKFLMTQGDPELATADSNYIDRYPESPEEAFSYDLVILGDVPAWYFTRVQLERMVELVQKRGGSLLMLAGDQHSPSTYVNTPLAEILPVRITADRKTVSDDVYPVPASRHSQSLAMLEPSPEANAAVWSVVRPLYRVPLLEGAKPAANVVLELPAGPDQSEAYPLVAWQYAGTGKAMYVGTDELWRLRFRRGDTYHARFWGQTIQFLALSRLLGENKRIRLEVDRAEPRAGERVEVHANVLDEFYQPVALPEYEVYLDRAAAEGAAKPDAAAAAARPVKLTAVPGTPGLYQGQCALPEEGRYVLRAKPEEKEISNTVDLFAAAADPEQREPAMQEALLRKMAELSGGRYLSIRQWPALPGMLGGKERLLVEEKTVDLWDRWPPYVLLVLCLGVEWFIRRRQHLV
jgi:hypothetical protein